jgi:tetratricopeptide (TPR) repeat protein
LSGVVGQKWLAWLGLALVAAAVTGAYANHFHNDFHFDDSHTIVTNVFVERLQNIPRFFVDASLFSSTPQGRTWRPLVSTSLAIDYWLGRGRNLFMFHFSTFLWFLVLLVVLFFLYQRLMDAAAEHPSNAWTALIATACYGLHPANAETVNYIIQRGDIYNTLGVAASLLWFIAWPQQRKCGWYLLPAAAACLAKAPALVFPLILLAYIWLFERDGERGSAKGAFHATWPAFATAGFLAILTVVMTPPTFSGGAASGSLYRLTQPWVALHYFRSFFLPTDLAADSDWSYLDPFGAQAMAGYLFVAALAALAWLTSKRQQTRPIAFGIVWFVVTLLPTSLMPLADVTNDHRMFFPFVGLTLAVFWSLRMVLLPRTVWMRAAIALLLPVLALEASGTWQRNKAWRTEETLWRDVTIKRPQNGRGMMNYALIFMNRHEFSQAMAYLQRASELRPDYPPNEVNLAIAYGGLGRDGEAVDHFLSAQKLAPNMEEVYLHYGRWLKDKGRLSESEAQLQQALKANPASFNARDLLMEVYAAEGKHDALDKLLEDSVKVAFNDDIAKKYMAERTRRQKSVTPEGLVNVAAKLCQDGRYLDCMSASKKAIELRPDFAEAYNNLAAAYLSLKMWDEGIQAAQKALALKPGYTDAQGNLDWAMAHRPKQSNASTH